MYGEISLYLYGDFEEAIKRGVFLHLQPDGIGKINLAEDRVGALSPPKIYTENLIFKPQRTGETGEIKIRMTDEESK